MNTSVTKAITELKAINAPVYDHLRGEYGCEFIIGAELRTNEDELVCDYYGEYFREHWNRTDIPVENRKIVHAFNIHDKVHKILNKYHLRAEWINPGQVGVYLD